MNRTSSFAAAAAAIALASAAGYAAEPPAGSTGRALDADDRVHCYGVHACKGHGFKAMEAGSCLSKGGTIGDLGAD